MTLADFLLARIAEDEEAAHDASARDVEWCVQESRAAEGWGTWEGDAVVLGGGKPLAVCDPQYGGGLVADHIARHDPARVLAECRARRMLIGSLEPMRAQAYAMERDNRELATTMHALVGGVEIALKFLALARADHPEWRPEWHPEVQG